MKKNRDCSICGEHIKKTHKVKVDKKGFRCHLGCAVKRIVFNELKHINENPELYPNLFLKKGNT